MTEPSSGLPTARNAISVPGAWHSGAPYSPAIRVGSLVFVSGVVPYRYHDGSTDGDDIVTQTSRVIDNIEHLLAATGLDLRDVVKTTVFLTDITLAGGMNEVYRVRFPEPFPARSTVQVGPLARPAFLIEMEAVAVCRVQT